MADDFYYPDVFVRCGEQRGAPYFKTDPVLIAEVLSPRTQRYDRGDKRLAYFTLPTLQDYVLIAQDKMHVDVYRRGDSERTACSQNAADVLQLNAVDFSITLADLYA